MNLIRNTYIEARAGSRFALNTNGSIEQFDPFIDAGQSEVFMPARLRNDSGVEALTIILDRKV